LVWRSQEPDNDIRPLATIRPMNPVRDTSIELREVRNSTQPSMLPRETPPPIHDPDVKLSGQYGNPFINVKHVRFSDRPAKTRALDDNNNNVEYSYVILDETNGQVRRSILPEGHIYDEKIESPMDNTQEGSDDDQSVSWTDDSSVASSEQPSDDDGHSDYGKGGFHSCPDNPKNSGFSNSIGEGTFQDEGELSAHVGDYLEPDPDETWRELFRGGANAESDGYAHKNQEQADARRQKWEKAAQRRKQLTSLPSQARGGPEDREIRHGLE
jgi:hypothetical protein